MTSFQNLCGFASGTTTAVPTNLRIKILKLGYSLGLTSIYWDETEGILKVSPSKRRIAWRLVQAFLVVLDEIFLFYQSTFRKIEGENAYSRRIQIRYYFALWMFMSCNHVGDIWAMEYVRLMNGLQKFKTKCYGTAICSTRSQRLVHFFALISLAADILLLLVFSQWRQGQRDGFHQGFGFHQHFRNTDCHDRGARWLEGSRIYDFIAPGKCTHRTAAEGRHRGIPHDHECIPNVRFLASM